MVMHQEQLDQVFGALSDATRRGMLAQLSQGPQTVSELAAPYAMSQPAISKHVRVLEKAGLIVRTKLGREHVIRANPGPAERAIDWISAYTKVWEQQFDAVEAYLEAKKRGQT